MAQYVINEMREALEVFFEKIRNIKEDNIYIALSGGRSLISFYEKIVQNSSQLEKEYCEKIKFCFADERLVHLDSDLSNYKLICNKLNGLINKNIITENQIIPVDVNNTNPSKDYNSKVPRVDIVLLGVGEDSHICSLFPNHASVRDESNGFILVENSPKPPSLRISMTKKMIRECKCSFIFFMGNEKKDAFNCFNNNDDNVELCPSKIAKESKECYVVSDINSDN